MCTAISFTTKDHYFGRNLDLDHHYKEEVVITSRNFPLFNVPNKHYAIIGMATIMKNYPLYYDATNEFGLSMAGLNFPDNAYYSPSNSNKNNIPPYALIPYLLCQCRNTEEALEIIHQINIVNKAFNDELPVTPLHWIIADQNKAYTIESTQQGLQIFENSIGVLTNNPPFPYHMYNLRNFTALSNESPTNKFAPALDLKPYSLGMGAFGLPGDLSSSSRFIKAAFIKWNSICEQDEMSSVCQFFHILGSVSQQQGCVKTKLGYEKTLYSSCCNTDKGIYYYTTYENFQITAINMFRYDLDSDRLARFPLRNSTTIFYEN